MYVYNVELKRVLQQQLGDLKLFYTFIPESYKNDAAVMALVECQEGIRGQFDHQYQLSFFYADYEQMIKKTNAVIETLNNYTDDTFSLIKVDNIADGMLSDDSNIYAIHLQLSVSTHE